jgi:hypothetical protein
VSPLTLRLKFPLSDDHAVCIAELDRKQYFLLLNMIQDIKNNYALVYDMVTKNMEKVRPHRHSLG